MTIEDSTEEKTIDTTTSPSRRQNKRKRASPTTENLQIAYTLGFASGSMTSEENLKPSSPSNRVTKRMRKEDAVKIVNLLPTETRLRAQIKDLEKLPKHSRYAIQRRKMLTRALELVKTCKDKSSPSEELLSLLSKLSL